MKHNKFLEEAHAYVGKGWWPIIDKYLPQIIEIAPDCNIIVKEKFGALRIGAVGKTTNQEKLLELKQKAENESLTICEVCGAPGTHRADLDWQQTLCEPCYHKALEEEWQRWYDAEESIEEKTDNLKRYLGDLYAVYAGVCNYIDPDQPDEELLALQRHIEHQFALDVMEEYSWEKDSNGKWHYVTIEEFYARCRAAKGLPPKEEK